MVFRIIYRMAGSFQFHALGIAYLPLPSAGELFIPVYKTGYSSSNFHKKGFVIHKNQAYIQIISHPWPRPGIGNLLFAIEFLEKLIALY